jgi:hypothetical protein
VGTNVLEEYNDSIFRVEVMFSKIMVPTYQTTTWCRKAEDHNIDGYKAMNELSVNILENPL